MTQSAAVMVRHSHKISTKCGALDKALEGGISRGQVVEMSGPPGCAKEQLLMNIVAAFIEVNEEVIFIGKYSIAQPPQSILNSCFIILDCQNMTSPASLIKFLESEA